MAYSANSTPRIGQTSRQSFRQRLYPIQIIGAPSPARLHQLSSTSSSFFSALSSRDSGTRHPLPVPSAPTCHVGRKKLDARSKLNTFSNYWLIFLACSISIFRHPLLFPARGRLALRLAVYQVPIVNIYITISWNGGVNVSNVSPTVLCVGVALPPPLYSDCNWMIGNLRGTPAPRQELDHSACRS